MPLRGMFAGNPPGYGEHVVVTAHEKFFGGDIGQRILFAYFQADIAAYGVHIAGISIDIVEVDINRFQVLQCDFSLFAARIIADHLLVAASAFSGWLSL